MLTLLSIAAGLGAGATLVLPGEVRVRGTDLALSSVAQIRCDVPETSARLAAFSLGWAPAPGYSRVLTGAALERELEAAFPGLDVIVDRGAACRVLPETRRLEGAELESKAQAELAGLFAGRDARIQPKSSVRDLDVPAARATFELRSSIERRELHAGDWSVPVQVWIDGVLYQTVWQSFTVELWAEMPVLVRDVLHGELLAPELVETRRVQLSGDAPPVPLDGRALSGAVLLRDLARGTPISARDVRRAQLVANGELVTLEVQKGSITARSTATCRSAGSLGDRIKILTADKTRELEAQVIGRALVRIEL